MNLVKRFSQLRPIISAPSARDPEKQAALEVRETRGNATRADKRVLTEEEDHSTQNVGFRRESWIESRHGEQRGQNGHNYNLIVARKWDRGDT